MIPPEVKTGPPTRPGAIEVRKMQRMAIGMRVCDVRNRLVGVVGRVNACCFEVEQKAAEKLNLVASAIYNIESGEVDLICDSTELSRYSCGMHSA